MRRGGKPDTAESRDFIEVPARENGGQDLHPALSDCPQPLHADASDSWCGPCYWLTSCTCLSELDN